MELLLKYPSAKQLKPHLSQWSCTATGSTRLRLYRALVRRVSLSVTCPPFSVKIGRVGSSHASHVFVFFFHVRQGKCLGEDTRGIAVAVFSPEPRRCCSHVAPKAADSVLNYCN